MIIPSWYSPEELLRTTTDIDLVAQRKSSKLLCSAVRKENSILNHYIFHQSDRLQEVLRDRYALLDAYLIGINEKQDDSIFNEKQSKQRTVVIVPPNETFEQRQLYHYANKFLPFKKKASFQFDQILSSKQ